MVVPWANQILPAAGPVRKVPAEEDDACSVVSVASSNTRVVKPDGDTDSDASAASEENATTEVVDLVTDEDESDEESEEDFELSEKEQRFLQEAYDVHTTTGDAWIQQRATSTPGCRTSFADAGNVQTTFADLAKLPDGWPLMRILIPLDGLSLQIERIVTCVAAELVVTHRSPTTLTKFVKRVAKKLTTVLACHLAIHSSSKLRKDTRIETARPSNGLVKIMCSPKTQGEAPTNATAYNKGHMHWLESFSHVQSLYVWVPAH